MILSFCWNKRAHRDTRADFIRLKGNEGLALSVFSFTTTGPLRSAWAVPIEMTSYFTGSEMSLPKTKVQWHFPRLKYNGMRLAALAGSEDSALLHTQSGEGFQQQARLLKDRSRQRGELGWLPVQFLIPDYISSKAVDEEEPCTSQSSSCFTCPCPEAPCIHCRCPMPRLWHYPGLIPHLRS